MVAKLTATKIVDLAKIGTPYCHRDVPLNTYNKYIGDDVVPSMVFASYAQPFARIINPNTLEVFSPKARTRWSRTSQQHLNKVVLEFATVNYL